MPVTVANPPPHPLEPAAREERPGAAAWRAVKTRSLRPSAFSIEIYGDSEGPAPDLLESIREHGVLVPLVVAPGATRGVWDVVSGHRRLACARALGLPAVPCEIRRFPSQEARRRAILEYNRQRCKTFSQLMREADALETLWAAASRTRRLANLRTPRPGVDRRNLDAPDRAGGGGESGPSGPSPRGRTDAAIAQHLGLGGKDLYRQARAVWKLAQQGDTRGRGNVAQLDAGAKTIHAAYKDLRRRDRFAHDFRPTPYDVWAFRHDGAFGIPHPGSIPPAIVAHAVHYFSPPDGLVVDPMAGGGTTLDVCASMGRRCLAYDVEPSRPEILRHDISTGFPPASRGCDLIFCDPPYHTMLAGAYPGGSVASLPLPHWIAFLHALSRHAFETLRPGGYLALLLAPQTEKDLPAGYGYIDHAFFGYIAALRAGFAPERRISCPMSAGYLPQQVRRARQEGRMLGQVRDLLIVRKPRDGAAAALGGIIPCSEPGQPLTARETR